jgi:phosphoglycolate phosphatase
LNIVFDLDGTLIDSALDIQYVASTLLSELGKQELSLAETRSFIGEGAAVFVSLMMAARGIEETVESHTRLYDDFLALYEVAVDEAAFYPDAFATLTRLKAEGHRLGLCTNKPERPTRAVLRHMSMDTMFEVVMAGGMIDSRKPAPDMLLQSIQKLGGGPSLYVGDSEIDAQTAQRAGVLFALFTEGYRETPVDQIHQNWCFDDFKKLHRIVAEACNK